MPTNPAPAVKPRAGYFHVILGAALFALIQTFPLLSPILHDELYRKRFLPSVTDADLDRLARNALSEKASAPK